MEHSSVGTIPNFGDGFSDFALRMRLDGLARVDLREMLPIPGRELYSGHGKSVRV